MYAAAAPPHHRPWAKLQCSSCGASADAACRCGTAYLPAAARAAEAIDANPGKSDRVIAEKIGVGSNTFRRARVATAPRGAVGQPSSTEPEKREGKDGKSRKMPKKKSAPRQHACHGP